MSTNLYWRPKPTSKRSLADRLKYILRDSFTDLATEAVTLNIDHLPYLTGLRDAGVEDAEKVIKAIQKYGEIEIWLAE